MKLKELDLLSLQTRFMQSDETTKGLCAALNTPMINASRSFDKILLWKNYRNLSEEALDALATSLNIPWYDSEADISVKAHIVEKADEVRLLIGTKKCIELVFEAWDVSVYILEWFNYGGNPYHYKIVVDYTHYERLYDKNGEPIVDKNNEEIYVLREIPFLPDGALLTKLTSILPILQPARCVLDSITTTADIAQNTYADIEALGTYGDLSNRFYWDLQYKL